MYACNNIITLVCTRDLRCSNEMCPRERWAAPSPGSSCTASNSAKCTPRISKARAPCCTHLTDDTVEGGMSERNFGNVRAAQPVVAPPPPPPPPRASIPFSDYLLRILLWRPSHSLSPPRLSPPPPPDHPPLLLLPPRSQGPWWSCTASWCTTRRPTPRTDRATRTRSTSSRAPRASCTPRTTGCSARPTSPSESCPRATPVSTAAVCC